jgi:hypothetical protein
MEISEELKNLILQAVEAENKEGTPVLGKYLSRNEHTMMMGSDPTEYYKGYDAISKALSPQIENLPKYTVTLGKVHAFSEGSVGWFVYTAVQKYETGSESPMRVNGVVHKEDGEWKVVFANFTLEVPNDKMSLILDKWN